MIDQFNSPTTPFGIKPIKSIIAAPFTATTIEMVVPNTDPAALFINDIVSTVENSDISGDEFGIEYCTRATLGNSFRGVITDIKVIHEYENSVYRAASTYRVIRVCQDPFLLCQAMVNAIILPTDVNRFINIDGGIGNTATGISSMQLDYATINDINGQFRITKILDITNTTENQYTIVECVIQKHEFLEGTVSSGDTYTNPLPTTMAVGGIPAGSTFYNTPKSFGDFVLAAQYPFIAPAFTSFAITGLSVVEVGTKITATETFTWAISNNGNVQANSIYIKDVTNNLTLIPAHSTTSPATYNFSLYAGGGLQYITPANNVFQISGTNIQLGSFNASYTTYWYWRVHSGMCIADTSSITNAQILALQNSSLTTAFPTQVTTNSGGYFHYLVPTSFTQPTTFKDHSTGFSIDMNARVVISVTNANGVSQNYYDYQSTEILDNTITIDVS